MAYDKKLHLIAGSVICVVGTAVSGNIYVGLGLSVVAGIIKEVYDKVSGKGTPELADSLYTSSGGILVTVSYNIYQFIKLM